MKNKEVLSIIGIIFNLIILLRKYFFYGHFGKVISVIFIKEFCIFQLVFRWHEKRLSKLSTTSDFHQCHLQKKMILLSIKFEGCFTDLKINTANFTS